MTTTTSPVGPRPDVLGDLSGVCAGRGLDALAGRLEELRSWLDGDLRAVETALAAVATGESLAHRAARHLLDLEGKRLRPVCVALASRVGSGFGPAARQLAIAVELVHSATLLHDDVVDLGDKRRGVDAARVVYGNAASIFGGDWLLVNALGRIQSAGVPGALERMLDVIRDMVVAEAEQLARRGKVVLGRDAYFGVVEGKTASLFRWAMWAGARAGGIDDAGCAALEGFGRDLGVAFQVVDDVLDVAGGAETGKTLFADLREGKMTYPVIVAVERDPSLVEALAEIAASDGVSGAAFGRAARALAAPEVVAACIGHAEDLAAHAAARLEALPASPARAALAGVARSAVTRRA